MRVGRVVKTSRRDVNVSRTPCGKAEEKDGLASNGSVVGEDEGPGVPSISVWLENGPGRGGCTS